MSIQQNNWGSDDGNTYLRSLGALSNLRYIGGALAIQQNFHLESGGCTKDDARAAVTGT